MTCRYVVHASVPDELADEWQLWMQEIHIPRVLSLPWFRGAEMFEEDRTANERRGFVIMYLAADRAAIDSYVSSDECRELRAEFTRRYGDTVLLRREILTPVS